MGWLRRPARAEHDNLIGAEVVLADGRIVWTTRRGDLRCCGAWVAAAETSAP